MTTTSPDALLALIDKWASHFGYYDGRIDLSSGDLSAVTTADCTLTAHAPLWRTKPGQEKAVAAAEVRKQLAALRLASGHGLRVPRGLRRPVMSWSVDERHQAGFPQRDPTAT